jgi:pyruvate dehydrogenase E2 component (dihydrolipoamide acetyltransferase)
VKLMPEVFMPRLDPGMQSGKIIEWLRKEGDMLHKGEPILVVEGEKTTFEIEASANGVLSKILVNIGTDVQVGEPVAIIGESGESPQRTPVPTTSPAPEPIAPSRAPPPLPARGERVVASPAARKLAREHSVDITSVRGTGPGGRITREDILAAVKLAPARSQPVEKPPQPVVSQKIKLDGIRRAVAERLGFSARTVVPVTLTMEADATKLVSLKDKTERISFTAFVVKAVARALEKHPNMNSSIEGDQINVYSDINICVAVNTDQGLVAPIIRNANGKSTREISTEIEQLSQKAIENRLALDELVGGTFTLSNLGAYDIETFAPVINPPQCAILGLGRIAYKPFAVNGQVTARPCTTLTLVFDHRIVDGVPASRFLREVKNNLEDAESLL